MPTYNVIKKSDEVVVYTYSAPEVVEWSGMSLEDHYHNEVIVTEVVPTEPSVPSVKITRLAFRNRFTTAEKIALELASKDNTAAPPAQRQQSAMIKVYLDDVNSAEFIDLNRKDTRQGVLLLETVGLIATGRAVEILDAVPKLEEIYNGN